MKITKLRITPRGKLVDGAPVYVKIHGLIIGMIIDGPAPIEVVSVKLDELEMIP